MTEAICMPPETDAVSSQQSEEVNVQKRQSNRNPIARSFGAGINKPQVVPGKRRDRRLKHKRPFWDGEE